MHTNRRAKKKIPRRRNDPGFIITLVAVFLLFVVGAMAALSIDVVTLYTARSEAQLAADAGALAGARVLANSGMTSEASLTANAEATAKTVAKQVAANNYVGGSQLKNSDVTVNINDNTPSNPHVTVQIQVKTLPTFFARIWGNQTLTVVASATAEAYNPSGNSISGDGPPVAPICVKPWLLPNIDPTKNAAAAGPIFGSDGSIANPTLVGQTWPNVSGATNANPNGLFALCAGDCSGGISPPSPGMYYPGAIDGPAPDFPTPAQVPTCAAGLNSYQMAVAGCVQQPISCGVNSASNPSSINIDQTAYGPTRDADTVQATGCLIHYSVPGGLPGDSDGIDIATTPNPPFEFLGGKQNPVTGAQNKPLVVSDSLVTIPVINVPDPPGSAPTSPTSPVTVIGFLQILLNPYPTAVFPPPLTPTQIPAMIINMAGCGTSATGQPILGNGASPVAVRLITPP
jgi:hypothetical protein